MRRLVLDANILIRAVLGSRVRGVITTYAADVEFFAPSTAYDEAERHLPEILTKHDRADQVEAALDYLTQLRNTVLPQRQERAVPRLTNRVGAARLVRRSRNGSAHGQDPKKVASGG